MSFIIQAPYPLMQDTLLLPSPRIGNQKNLSSSVQTMISMNGKMYSYVKSKQGRKLHKWDFIGTKDKGREVIQFVKEYSDELVKVVDHDETSYLGYITINPLEISGIGREAYSWSISFEEKL